MLENFLILMQEMPELVTKPISRAGFRQPCRQYCKICSPHPDDSRTHEPPASCPELLFSLFQTTDHCSPSRIVRNSSVPLNFNLLAQNLLHLPIKQLSRDMKEHIFLN